MLSLVVLVPYLRLVFVSIISLQFYFDRLGFTDCFFDAPKMIGNQSCFREVLQGGGSERLTSLNEEGSLRIRTLLAGAKEISAQLNEELSPLLKSVDFIGEELPCEKVILPTCFIPEQCDSPSSPLINFPQLASSNFEEIKQILEDEPAPTVEESASDRLRENIKSASVPLKLELQQDKETQTLDPNNESDLRMRFEMLRKMIQNKENRPSAPQSPKDNDLRQSPLMKRRSFSEIQELMHIRHEAKVTAALFRENVTSQKMRSLRTDFEILVEKERVMELVDVVSLQKDLEFYRKERIYLYSKVFGCDKFQEPQQADLKTKKSVYQVSDSKYKQIQKELFSLKKLVSDQEQEQMIQSFKEKQLFKMMSSYETQIMSSYDVNANRKLAVKRHVPTINESPAAVVILKPPDAVQLDLKPASKHPVGKVLTNIMESFKEMFHFSEKVKSATFERILRAMEGDRVLANVMQEVMQTSQLEITTQMTKGVQQITSFTTAICQMLVANRNEGNVEAAEVGIQTTDDIPELRYLIHKDGTISLTEDDDTIQKTSSKRQPGQLMKTKDGDICETYDENCVEKVGEDENDKSPNDELLVAMIEDLRSRNEFLQNEIQELQERDSHDVLWQPEEPEKGTEEVIASRSVPLRTVEQETSNPQVQYKNDDIQSLRRRNEQLNALLRTKFKDVETRALALHHSLFRFCSKLRTELQVPTYLLQVKPPKNRTTASDGLDKNDVVRHNRILEIVAQDERLVECYCSILEKANANRVGNLKDAVNRIKTSDQIEPSARSKVKSGRGKTTDLETSVLENDVNNVVDGDVSTNEILSAIHEFDNNEGLEAEEFFEGPLQTSDQSQRRSQTPGDSLSQSGGQQVDSLRGQHVVQFSNSLCSSRRLRQEVDRFGNLIISEETEKEFTTASPQFDEQMQREAVAPRKSSQGEINHIANFLSSAEVEITTLCQNTVGGHSSRKSSFAGSEDEEGVAEPSGKWGGSSRRTSSDLTRQGVHVKGMSYFEEETSKCAKPGAALVRFKNIAASVAAANEISKLLKDVEPEPEPPLDGQPVKALLRQRLPDITLATKPEPGQLPSKPVLKEIATVSYDSVAAVPAVKKCSVSDSLRVC